MKAKKQLEEGCRKEYDSKMFTKLKICGVSGFCPSCNATLTQTNAIIELIEKRIKELKLIRQRFLDWDYSIGNLTREDVFRNLVEVEWGIQEYQELLTKIKGDEE